MTAMNQHMVGLEQDALITNRSTKCTGRCPGWIYQMTDNEMHWLPKQCSWFSELLHDTLEEELGSQRL